MARVKLNYKGFQQLRHHPRVQADLAARAERIAAAAGEGFEPGTDHRADEKTSRASVVAVTIPARRRNAKHNTLVQALDAGRG